VAAGDLGTEKGVEAMDMGTRKGGSPVPAFHIFWVHKEGIARTYVASCDRLEDVDFCIRTWSGAVIECPQIDFVKVRELPRRVSDLCHFAEGEGEYRVYDADGSQVAVAPVETAPHADD
jgi:predicted ThiF/HesA family dinucleotide-utilizing enzyme